MNQWSATPQEIIAGVVGQVCWRARRGYSSCLTFDFGKRISVPTGGRGDRAFGEWHLWVYFGTWQLLGPDGATATNHDDELAIERVMEPFNGKRVTEAVVEDTLEATFSFETALLLHLGLDAGDEEPGERWLLFTPEDRVLAVGPGPTWRYQSSDEPGL